MVQLLRAREPTHPPLRGSPTPSATATVPRRRSTLPGNAAAGHAVAASARLRPRHALSNHPEQRFPRLRKTIDRPKKAESAYPRPRDRRVSRKTRAAVGKPSGSTTAVPTVSNAGSPDAMALPIGHQEAASPAIAVAIHLILAQHRPNSISPLAESARLMPVTASPMLARAGALAGLIS